MLMAHHSDASQTHSFHIHYNSQGGTTMKYINRYRVIALNVILVVAFYVVATGFSSCGPTKPY